MVVFNILTKLATTQAQNVRGLSLIGVCASSFPSRLKRLISTDRMVYVFSTVQIVSVPDN